MSQPQRATSPCSSTGRTRSEARVRGRSACRRPRAATRSSAEPGSRSGPRMPRPCPAPAAGDDAREPRLPRQELKRSVLQPQLSSGDHKRDRGRFDKSAAIAPTRARLWGGVSSGPVAWVLDACYGHADSLRRDQHSLHLSRGAVDVNEEERDVANVPCVSDGGERALRREEADTCPRARSVPRNQRVPRVGRGCAGFRSASALACHSCPSLEAQPVRIPVTVCSARWL